ncbi:uncharacterized protein LOC114532472 [Dendronephthya gigantea]|uniref:uncharacterized protein LOC114532472 n=1 Tax=Dendronephthya gigantea TaxID=151771 RepID=UPI00106C7500|nr:uncharacterized protein LOC114532472 [Dendronephthya gigantea]
MGFLVPTSTAVFFIAFFVNGLDAFSRSSCTHTARFDNPQKDKSLDGNVIETVNVIDQTNCVIICLEHPDCESINYHVVSSSPTHVCELNSKNEHDVSLTDKTDVIHYGPNISQLPDCAQNGPGECQNGAHCASSCANDQKLMCHCREGTTGSTCAVVYKNQDFTMVFPTRSVQNYILIDDSNVPEMAAFTLMFWVTYLRESVMTVLTYGLENEDIKLNIKTDGFYFRVLSGTKGISTPPIFDGYWHHVGITWSLGEYVLYIDGTLIESGEGLGPTTPVTAGGKFHIGQRYKSERSFDETKSFAGKLTQLNMWDKIFTEDEIKSTSGSCINDVGTILDWSTVVSKAHGAVFKESLGLCRTLRDDPVYDVMMTADASKSTQITRIETSVSLTTFKNITISTWAQHDEYMRYISYRSSTGAIPYLSFRLEKDVLILDIVNVVRKEARVPRYWKEDPALWHHVATTWSGDTGVWQIFLDGSLVSTMENVAVGHELPTKGTAFIGVPEPGDLSMTGSLTRFNIWNLIIDGGSISIMARSQQSFPNGNVFAWSDVKSKVTGDMEFEKTPSGVRNRRSGVEYQMKFPAASSSNYALLYNVFPEPVTVFAACFWAKILDAGAAVYSYSTKSYSAEIQSYVYSYELDLIIQGVDQSGPDLSSPSNWHFYCQQWRSSDGLIETWQDGKKLQSKTRATGKVVEPGGAMIIGQEPDSYVGSFSSSQAFKGTIAGLNMWTDFLTSNEIQGMCGGLINVNGNLFRWRDISLPEYRYGDVTKALAEPALPEFRVQKLRDEWCIKNYNRRNARFVRIKSGGYKWRCMSSVALLPENMCYDIDGASPSYNTRDPQLLAIV